MGKTRLLLVMVISVSLLLGMCTTVSYGAVKTPGKVSLTSVSLDKTYPGTVHIKWKKASKAKGYQIFCSNEKNGKYEKVGTVKKSSKVKYDDIITSDGSTYYYKVRAYNKSGSKTKYGKFSTIKSVRSLDIDIYAEFDEDSTKDRIILVIENQNGNAIEVNCKNIMMFENEDMDGEALYDVFAYMYKGDDDLRYPTADTINIPANDYAVFALEPQESGLRSFDIDSAACKWTVHVGNGAHHLCFTNYDLVVMAE